MVHPVVLRGTAALVGEEAGEHHVRDTPSASDMSARGAADGPPVPFLHWDLL